MLYQDFDAKKRMDGKDVFTKRVDTDVVKNLNPSLTIREYQKEALGRLDFYTKQYQNCKK